MQFSFLAQYRQEIVTVKRATIIVVNAAKTGSQEVAIGIAGTSMKAFAVDHKHKKVEWIKRPFVS